MKSGAGRVILFDALAEGISPYYPDTNPRTADSGPIDQRYGEQG
uniref:Uncharacterized protein n=1 Tax=Candidatus Kentrum sp. UNK TaxID=2126344 RepID=A0A451AYI0_9GAMM|nr:MAG: hypothetical protein BECKUNK1418G_GA0071005_11264 [Candidatus Kentron sp. UNK]VFK71084.1 MAG: hypothetical protein BECKUNK1418H_GA0071006_10504 [Candidatus Kentron sp. UNK]